MDKKYTIDWLYTTYKDFYDLYEIREDNFKTVYKGRGCSVFDFAWYGFNLILSKIAEAYQAGTITEEKFYRSMKEVYWEMTLFQRRHENKKGNHTHKQFLHNYLLWNKVYNIMHIDGELDAIIISNNCCEYCDTMHLLKNSLDKEIKLPLFDSNKCKHHYGCRAVYGFEIKDDDN